MSTFLSSLPASSFVGSTSSISSLELFRRRLPRRLLDSFLLRRDDAFRRRREPFLRRLRDLLDDDDELELFLDLDLCGRLRRRRRPRLLAWLTLLLRRRFLDFPLRAPGQIR